MSKRELLYLETTGHPNVVMPAIQSAGWQIHVARDSNQAREIIDSHNVRVGLTLLDTTHQTERDLFEVWPASGRMEWVAMLPAQDLESARLAPLISEYFYDYHTLPADVERLLFSLGHAYGMATMARTYQRHIEEDVYADEMIGNSPAMQRLLRAMRKVANVDAPLLITGESGVGKELAALVVHERSSRRNHPFVTVSCSAQSIEALMQELFGDESGTADTTRRRGRLEAAAGGTLFLDEVAELPLEVQARLLRFLKEKTIERNGADRLRVDVRVMAATRANLVREVEAGRFRDDLYYHLQVLTLDVPALRDRERDVEQLAQYFFEKFAIEKGRNLKGFSDKAVEVLQAHDWPGNVREVMNRVRRAIVMCDKRIISPQDLGLNAAAVCGRVLTLDRAREEAERVAILASLKQTRHNVSRAARLLGVSRVTLYRLMDKHSINT
ncbi:MAG: hypothetical protein AMJ84_08360 [Acidithiobacillales bacterium SM23_46]|jgi:DNA-binding NtrC family response regulator|nr:MAG: hypothetical protein AMJ84_08360 [Acidithiobacillales bacterium SM23_46]